SYTGACVSYGRARLRATSPEGRLDDAAETSVRTADLSSGSHPAWRSRSSMAMRASALLSRGVTGFSSNMRPWQGARAVPSCLHSIATHPRVVSINGVYEVLTASSEDPGGLDITPVRRRVSGAAGTAGACVRSS